VVSPATLDLLACLGNVVTQACLDHVVKPVLLVSLEKEDMMENRVFLVSQVNLVCLG